MPGWAFRRPLVLAALAVVAALALAAATAHRFADLGAAGSWLTDRLAGALAPVHDAAVRVREGYDALAELGRLRAENARLRAELARYRALEPALDEAIESLARLKALLGLKEWYGEPALAARVVLRSPDRWLEQVVIDAGRDDGVAPGMPVVTAEGLVGRVVDADARTAVVMLLTDPDSGVGGLVLQTREAGVVLGSHVLRGRLLMRLFVADARVEPGQLVVTSGYGGLLPPGLPVGVVEKVERDRLVPLATLRPVADLERLTEVVVLRVVGGPGLRASPWLQPPEGPARPERRPAPSGQEVR